MYTCIKSLAQNGLDAVPVDVEADISKALPSFDIVGLGDTTIREAKDRIRAAFKNSGFEFPVGKIVVNLAPANLPKTGSFFDLPIFIALLTASNQLNEVSAGSVFIGELSINGAIRPVRGVLSKIIYARENSYERVFIPEENRLEASAVSGIEVYTASHVRDVVAHLRGESTLPQVTALDFESLERETAALDYSDVRGQVMAKRAMEIAAAGGHNLLMIGPPGSGKSMLAKRLPSILPDLTFEEAIEVTKIYSICESNRQPVTISKTRPFRSPHYNASLSSITGGGAHPTPGEISLSHNGVLFLDEIVEFQKNVLEALRQPLEDHTVTISRALGSATYPCNFQLIGAMNPCRCGYFGHPDKPCSCSPAAVTGYLRRISGPLLDRFDIHIEVAPVNYSELSDSTPSESSASIRQRVDAARAIQRERFKGTGLMSNSAIPSKYIHTMCRLTPEADRILARAFAKYSFSARINDRVLKVARTIADLDDSPVIDSKHIMEAVQYRILERKYWNR